MTTTWDNIFSSKPKKSCQLTDSHEIIVTKCPHCGHKIDMSTGTRIGTTEQLKEADAADRTPPKPNDYTVCLYCSELSVYGENCQLRKPTPEEQISINNDPDSQQLVREMQEITKKVRESRRSKS